MEAHFAEQALFNLNLIRFPYRLIETIVYQKCMHAFLISVCGFSSQTVLFIFIKMSKKMFFLECQVFGLSKDSFRISSSYLR